MKEFTLASLGWDSWFEAQVQDLCEEEKSVARVATVDRDQMLLYGEGGSFRAKLSGKYIYDSESMTDRPCVGDWVFAEKPEDDQFGVVHKTFKRRTHLRRKVAGDAVKYQMIAANVDFVIIVQSCHYDFSLKRLERYLVMIKDGGAMPLIILTKIDLVTPEELADQIEQIHKAGITEPVVTLSNITNEGLDELKSIISAGKTYCVVGSSGVGKSTLINSLVGQKVQDTKVVSDTGEGQHTTVRRHLILLENGAMVIDNPGMRGFGIFGAEDGLEASYSDIRALALQCHFRDCTHTTEPGCAVLIALERGELDAEHHDNFVKLSVESDNPLLSSSKRRKKNR